MKKIGLLTMVCLYMCMSGCTTNNYTNEVEEVQEQLLSTAELGWDSIFEIPSHEEIKNYNESATKRSPYIYAWFSVPQDTRYTEYTIDFKAGHLPKGTYCNLGCWYMDYSYLESQYESVRVDSTIHAYAGFQNIHSGQKVSIMSFWDVFCKDYTGKETMIRAKRVYPATTDYSEDFTGEGTGAHCSVPYDWVVGHWYRMHLKCRTSSETGNTVVEQWVCDLATEEYTLLCSYDIGVPNSAFKGQIAVFLENYMPEYAGDVRSMEICNAKYLAAATEQWVTITDAYVGSDSGLPNYEGSYDFGVANDHIWMITSGVGGDWFNNGKGKQATTLNMGEKGQ